MLNLAISLAFMLLVLGLFGWASSLAASFRTQRAWGRLPAISATERLEHGPPGLRGAIAPTLRFAGRHLGPLLAAGVALLAYILTRSIPPAFAAGVLVLALGHWNGKRAYAKRRRLLQEQVVELVEALIQPLRAGLSLPGALESAAEEVPEPLCSEVRRAVSDIQLGMPLDTVMEEFAGRCGGGDLHLVSAALLQQRAAGGNLAQLLDTLKGVMRDRSMLKREVRVLTAQGRLSGYLVASLPAAFLAIECIFSRSAIKALFGSPLGLAILTAGLGLEILGLFLIRRICNLKEA